MNARDSRIADYRRLARRHNAIATAIENGTQHVIEIEAKRCWVTPAKVASVLGLSAQSANNRLRDLCELSICERRYVNVPGGGRAFEYRWIYDWSGYS